MVGNANDYSSVPARRLLLFRHERWAAFRYASRLGRALATSSVNSAFCVCVASEPTGSNTRWCISISWDTYTRSKSFPEEAFSFCMVFMLLDERLRLGPMAGTRRRVAAPSDSRSICMWSTCICRPEVLTAILSPRSSARRPPPNHPYCHIEKSQESCLRRRVLCLHLRASVAPSRLPDFCCDIPSLDAPFMAHDPNERADNISMAGR